MLDNRSDPEIGTTSFTYDNIGHVKSRTLASISSFYDYDPLYRLTRVTHSDSTAESDFGYDRTGRVKMESLGGVGRYYNYDANGNLLTETQRVDDVIMHAGYVYDGNDNLSAINYPAGKHIDYAPDEFGQPRSVSGLASGITYYPSGTLKALTYGNGLNSTFDLDTRLRPKNQHLIKSIVNPPPTGGTTNVSLLNTTNDYDGVSNLKSLTETVDNTLNRSLRYDGIDRLIGADSYWGTGTIGYDGRGNITLQQFGADGTTRFNYTYDASTNRLTGTTGARTQIFTYDGHGNVTYNGQHTFQYDALDNLNCVDCNSSNRIDFSYAPSQVRVKKIKAAARTYYFKSHAGQDLFEYDPATHKATEYYYLGSNLLAKRDFTDAVLQDGDADGDGMSDQKEVRYQLNPFDKTDANRDDDGDGLTNAQEIAAGRNPKVDERKAIPVILQLLLD